MKSMTGFGRDQGDNKDVSVNLSVKTVNGRYLDVKILGPRLYGELEASIKKEVGKVFQRGTVEIHINRQSQGGTETVVFNQALAKKWLSGFQGTLKALKISGEVTPQVLLNIPELYRVEEKKELASAEKTLFLKTLKGALQACSKQRSREGEAVKKDIQSHMQALSKQSKAIAKLRKSAEQEYQEKYRSRLEKIMDATGVDEARCLQEVAILVEKSDIAEELQRLETHIKEVGALLVDGDRVGKKLDFFAQELLREVNTIGSKSVTAAITQKVVECKGTIEKFREQVQNIE